MIGSLIFVGLQLKQSQEIARSQASQNRTWGTVEAYVTKASTPTLNSAEAKLWAGVTDQLEPEEVVALYWDYAAVLKMTEDNLLQFRNGFLSEERWTASLEGLKCQYSSFPLFAKADVQIGRNWAKLGSAFGHKRSSVTQRKTGARPATQSRR